MLLFKRNYVPVCLAALSCETALVLNDDPVGVDIIFLGSIPRSKSGEGLSKNLKIYSGDILF